MKIAEILLKKVLSKMEANEKRIRKRHRGQCEITDTYGMAVHNLTYHIENALEELQYMDADNIINSIQQNPQEMKLMTTGRLTNTYKEKLKRLEILLVEQNETTNTAKLIEDIKFYTQIIKKIEQR